MKTHFSPRAVLLLVAMAMAMFALSVLLGSREREYLADADGRAGPGAFSLSALGHAGLHATLRRLDWPTARLVDDVRANVGPDDILVLAEPDLKRRESIDALLLSRVSRVLLVLPKWEGTPQPGRSAWVTHIEPIRPYASQAVARMVEPEAKVERLAWPPSWPVNSLRVQPTGAGPVQLVESADMKPIVAGPGGMLVGEARRGGRIVWILADPDVMANHGLVKGDNAGFMIALLEGLAGVDGGGPRPRVVFDETIHGLRTHRGGPAGLLFRFPYLAATALLCLTALLLAWSGYGRFGPAATPPPTLDFGKSGLIRNSARLLDQSGHRAAVLRRYVEMVVEATARRLHGPAGRGEDETLAWLDRIGKARRARRSCSAILRAARSAGGNAAGQDRLYRCAKAIYRWKEEVLDGPESNRRDSRDHTK